MKSNLFVTGLLLNGEPSFTTNNPVTNKLYFTKEKFVHEEIVCNILFVHERVRIVKVSGKGVSSPGVKEVFNLLPVVSG